jgi:putative phosphoesterase
LIAPGTSNAVKGGYMKALIVSDSHGETENLKRLSLIAKEEKVRRIIHLGDDYDDADLLVNEGITINRVPGVFSAYYTEKSVENRKVIELEGWKILLTHTRERHNNDRPDDTPPEQYVKNGTVDIVLYGHSHVPAIGIDNNVYLINPGHLKSDDKRGYEPSFAILNIEKASIEVIIRALVSGKILFRESLQRNT